MTGSVFIYAGKVGTSTHTVLLDLRARLHTLEQRLSPFDEADLPYGPQAHRVTPQLVVEIGFHEWTQNGLLRQPRFEGLQMDQSPLRAPV